MVTQDTKPHREIPLSQVLDALEFEIPQHQHRHPGALASPPVAVAPHSHGSTSAAPDSGRDGDAHGQHTFKIITTKRTLLLCAPGEEEEIRWLSAVRALIARRSGAGPHPNAGTAPPGAGPVPAGQQEPAGEAEHRGHSHQASTSGSSVLRGKVRRLSISGSFSASKDEDGGAEKRNP